MGYTEAASKLKPLQSFDPAVFHSTDADAQAVCDFVLALALTYNDYRDVLMAQAWLSEMAVPDGSPPSPRRALEGGLRIALLRTQAGIVHELLGLVSRSKNIVGRDLFSRLVGQLSREGRVAWIALRDVAFERPSADPLAKTLLLVRNKVAFHYDREQIGAGFRRAFIDPKTNYTDPMICRGVSLEESRFCFADAAAEAYVQDQDPDCVALSFLECKGALPRQLHHALFEIVTRFVQLRGGAWRAVP